MSALETTLEQDKYVYPTESPRSVAVTARGRCCYPKKHEPRREVASWTYFGRTYPYRGADVKRGEYLTKNFEAANWESGRSMFEELFGERYCRLRLHLFWEHIRKTATRHIGVSRFPKSLLAA